MIHKPTTTRYLSKRIEIRISARSLHPHVHCSVIHNSQDMKQPKRPPVDNWIKKVWYEYTWAHHPAIRKKEILPFAITQMKFEGIMLSEISQSGKDKYCMISLVCEI
uniref:Uncharacterized protein n=1 Tax=Equus caballus TaxID=9796 RepID=A0A9L0RQM6_HORSE